MEQTGTVVSPGRPKASPKRRTAQSPSARPKRAASPRKEKEVPYDQLLEKLLQLEKYKVQEEKEKKKEESQRKKDLLAAKKKLNREISTTKGAVKKKTNEVTKLKSALQKLEAKHGDSEKKKQFTASKLDETIRKTEEQHNKAEVELATKIGEMGEARGTLAYLEYAQEMLEKGIMLPRDPQSALEAAAMGRRQAIESYNTEALADTPDKVAAEVAQVRQALELAQEERPRLDKESVDYHAEWQEELHALRGQVGQLRDENQALKNRLDHASSTVKTQDDRIETLRSRLQMATATMKEKVERIEELTETVGVTQAEGISPSSTTFPDGQSLDPTAATFTSSSIGNTAVEGIFQAYPGVAKTVTSTAMEVPRCPDQRLVSASGEVGKHQFTEMKSFEVSEEEISSGAGLATVSTTGSSLAMGMALPTAPSTIANAGAISSSTCYLQDEIFDYMDTDKDGVVSRVEFSKAVKAGLLAQGGRLTTSERFQMAEEGTVPTTTAQAYIAQPALGSSFQLGATPRALLPGSSLTTTTASAPWMAGSFSVTASRSSSVPRPTRQVSKSSRIVVSPPAPTDQLSMTSTSLGTSISQVPQVASSTFAGNGTFRYSQATTPPVLLPPASNMVQGGSLACVSRERSVGRFQGTADMTSNYTPSVGSTAEAAYAALSCQQVPPVLSSSFVAAAPQRMFSGRLGSSPPAYGGTLTLAPAVQGAVGNRASSPSPQPPTAAQRSAASTLLCGAPLAPNPMLLVNTPRQAASTSAMAAASAAAASFAMQAMSRPQVMPTELIARDHSEMLAHERAQGTTVYRRSSMSRE